MNEPTRKDILEILNFIKDNAAMRDEVATKEDMADVRSDLADVRLDIKKLHQDVMGAALSGCTGNTNRNWPRLFIVKQVGLEPV